MVLTSAGTTEWRGKKGGKGLLDLDHGNDRSRRQIRCVALFYWLIGLDWVFIDSLLTHSRKCLCVALFYYTDGSKGLDPICRLNYVPGCAGLCGFVLSYRQIKRVGPHLSPCRWLRRFAPLIFTHRPYEPPFILRGLWFLAMFAKSTGLSERREAEEGCC